MSPGSEPPLVFINYRIADTKEISLRLADDLRRELGVGEVFLDKRDIEAGESWPEELRCKVGQAKVVIVMIGRKWLTECTEFGRRRLDLDDDWVRLEIALALQGNGLVLPLLVGDTDPVPKKAIDNLANIAKLADLQSEKLRGEDWDNDLARVLDRLEQCGFQRAKQMSPVRSPEVEFLPVVVLDGSDEIVGQIAEGMEGETTASARNRLREEMLGLYRGSCEELGVDYSSARPNFLGPSGVGGLRLETAKLAHLFAHDLKRRTATYRSDLPTKNRSRKVRVAIHGGPRDDPLRVLDSANRLADLVPENGVLISDFVREHLDVQLRRSYQELPGLEEGDDVGKVYVWLSAGSRVDRPALESRGRAFVIMPYGSYEVFDRFIKPACRSARFEPHLAQWELSEKVIPNVFACLRDEPMALAYLGHPPWNANVMLEVGVRLAVGRPLVLVRDAPEGDEEVLPFDVGDRRVILLPKQEELEDRPVAMVEKINEIAQTMEANLIDSGWREPHPCATVRIDQDREESSYTESSELVDHIFQNSVKGMPITSFIADLEPMMHPDQFSAFVMEQQKLINEVLGISLFRKGRVPSATIPIVIARHQSDPDLVGRGFLPVIVRYWRQGGEARLTVLYLDVTCAMEKQVRGGREVFVANLAEVAVSA